MEIGDSPIYESNAELVVIPTKNNDLENLLNSPIEIRIKIVVTCPDKVDSKKLFQSPIGKLLCDYVKSTFPTSTSSDFFRLNVVNGTNCLIGFRYTLTERWINLPSSFVYKSSLGNFTIKSYVLDRKTIELSGISDSTKGGLRSKLDKFVSPFFDNYIIRCQEGIGDAYRCAQLIIAAIPKLMRNVCRIFFKDVSLDLKWQVSPPLDSESGLIVLDEKVSCKTGLNRCLELIRRYKDGDIYYADVRKSLIRPNADPSIKISRKFDQQRRNDAGTHGSVPVVGGDAIP